MARKQPAVKKPETLEEHIAAALEARARFAERGGMLPPMPGNVKYEIGQEVEVGRLENCKIVGFNEDKRYIVIEYDDRDTSYGKNIYLGRTYGAWPWIDVNPKLEPDAEITRFSREPVIGAMSNTDLDSILSRAMYREITDSPDYQRGYVWEESDKVKLIDSIFNARDIGKFIFVKNPYPEAEEILDGKQRISAILDFMSSKFPYKGKFWHEISPRDKNMFTRLPVQYAEIDSTRLDREQRLRIFLDLNSAGVPQTEEHLQYVQGLLSEEVARKEGAKRKMRP